MMIDFGMTSVARKAALGLSLLAITACANPQLNDANTVDLGANAGGTLSTNPGVSDPSSPEYFQQTVGDRVLFQVDQSSLTPEAKAVLDGQAGWLSVNADFMAIIEGHADEQGTQEYNLALGARRANSVREYLVANGVPAARLRTLTFGKERPAEICAAEACYAKNRRAVTIISAGGLSS